VVALDLWNFEDKNILEIVKESKVMSGKMTKVELVCLLLTACCLMELTMAAPVESGPDVVDEIIAKLKQLRQQTEGKVCGVEVCS